MLQSGALLVFGKMSTFYPFLLCSPNANEFFMIFKSMFLWFLNFWLGDSLELLSITFISPKKHCKWFDEHSLINTWNYKIESYHKEISMCVSVVSVWTA